ncbi:MULTISPECIES: restriction endonuclease subunit S [unclassified Caballeronia]|uniref:restriction endonuclease subunit S n=1 Tax=unclassified Caballeronia TaxID=2646786 RepID=UPI0028589E8D|nr:MULTISPECIES: restriction endonuclease subunit S [unclassified Caballeronia]MDR5752146.1 restriction endonuclease subunit S [Caballeronia sp. LZ024]MDR5843713.1 restriction endonuclease subunit S [Caballeronia sp. LZ031]
MSWEWVSIGECVELVSGPAFKSENFTDDTDDIPLVKGENVQQAYVDWGIAKRWPKTDADTYERFLLRPNDIVLAMDRPWVPAGLKWAFITANDPQGLLVQRVARLRANAGSFPGFLKYIIASEEFTGYVKNIQGGTNVPHISGEQIRSFKFRQPPLAAQKKIGDILSTYDDLIANNRRRIALLEQSARLLYREWFVHLRFPGHEHVKVVDGVPVGWDRKPLGNVAKLNYGKALKAEHREAGNFPVYGSSGIVGNHKAALSEGPGIIIGRKGNVGKTFWSSSGFFPIDTVYFVDAETSNLYLYYALQNAQFISTDVAVPGLNRDFAHSRPILIPPAQMLDEFLESVTPMHQQIDKLTLYNAKLREVRDLLLPRLMNGEIQV